MPAILTNDCEELLPAQDEEIAEPVLADSATHMSKRQRKMTLVAGACLAAVLVAVGVLVQKPHRTVQDTADSELVVSKEMMPAVVAPAAVPVDAAAPAASMAAVAAMPANSPYDCAAGFANWAAGWSAQKKTWCCQMTGKACPTTTVTTSTITITTVTTVVPPATAIPPAGVTTPIIGTSVAFDCDAGFANWAMGWSEPKKVWCCDNTGKACPTTAAPVPVTTMPVGPVYDVPPGTVVQNGYMLVGPPGAQQWVPAPTVKPVPICHTAEDGDKCFSSAVWDKYIGMNLHPEWYPGLDHNSTLEQFQERLSKKDDKAECKLPCDTNTNLVNKQPWTKPSFFCFSVAQPGEEQTILHHQVMTGSGIFACEESAIFSQTKMTIGGWPLVHSIILGNVPIGVSQDGTSANTGIFKQVWTVVKADARYKNHEFTIKADPDAVIFPWRIRTHIGSNAGRPVFVRNCNKFPGSPNFPMMYGAVEILSREAVDAYLANQAKCESLPWQQWGEDYFLGKCLQMVGVAPVDDYGIVRDGACSGLWCKDKQAAAYHPLKSVGDWIKCHDEAA